jgi:hypothetical protein
MTDYIVWVHPSIDGTRSVSSVATVNSAALNTVYKLWEFPLSIPVAVSPEVGSLACMLIPQNGLRYFVNLEE